MPSQRITRSVELPYRKLLDTVNDIVYTRDLGGVITSINAAGARFFGRPQFEIVGCTLHDLFGDPTLLVSLEATNAKLLAEGTDRSTTTFVDATGRTRIIETSTSLLRDASGRPIGASGVMRDMTETVENAQRLADALERLRELDRVKASFAAMLAHDLRSPLGTVSIALDLLSRQLDVRDQSDLLPIAESATISCGGLLTLVDEMLYIFRTDSEEIALDPVPLDVVAVVRETLAGLMAQASRAGIRFAADLPHESPPLVADAVGLRRVLTNLVANAVKFTPEGGEVRVAVLGRDDGAVEFRVSDTGEGIHADALPHVFDPYWQGPSKRSRVGMGLGLAIVKRIVEAHGGWVSAASVVGEGSTFTVVIGGHEA
jgi:PAS domain S-box-containing protein